MKLKTKCFYFLTAFGLFSSLYLHAADSTNVPSHSVKDYVIWFDAIRAEWRDIAPEKTQAAATNGDATAQLYLALQIVNDPTQTNLDKAIYWCQLAAEQGLTSAQTELGWIYGLDHRVKHNNELAEKWMRRAAKQGFAQAEYWYGYLLENEFDKNGQQIATNFPAAGEWLKKSAEQGYAKAQYELAEMYNSGRLGDNQRSNCIPWYLKAAAQGNAAAQAEVGELSKFYPGSELLKSVDNIEILRQSAESGNLDAQYQLARRYQTGDGVPKDSAEAFKYMEEAAQHDRRQSSTACKARYYLGTMYENGEGVQKDIQKAYKLYLDAAIVNTTFSADAAFRAGQMYEKGEGVPQDDYQAATLYYGAIVQLGGSSYKYQAVENLFRLYSEGRGLPPNDEAKAMRKPEYKVGKQLKYLEGDIKTPKAQFYVGKIYYQGTLVPKDFVETAAWFQLAANQNLDDARKMLDDVEQNLPPLQKEAVENRAKALAIHISLTH